MTGMDSIWREWVGARANLAVLFALPLLAAAAGSSASVLFFGCLLWNLAGLALGKLKLPQEPMVLWTASVLFAYAALRFASVFLSDLPDVRTLDAFKPLAFLAFLPIVCALTHAPVKNALTWFLRGAAIGAIVAAATALLQIYGLSMDRAEGLAGNPGPFATLMVLSGGMSAGLVASAAARDRLLGMVGSAASLLAAMLAGSKGIFPGIVVVAALSLVFLVQEEKIRLRLRTAVISIAVIAATTLVSLPVVNWRFVQLQDDIASMEKGQLIRSIGSRLVMWEEGFGAFLEKPVFGHGYNLRAEVVREEVTKRTGDEPGSHLHNGFVTDLTGNGVAGLATHLAVLFSPFLLMRGRDISPDTRIQRHAAAVVVLTYAITDITNLTFGHDILDCWFVFFLAVIASLRINVTVSEPKH